MDIPDLMNKIASIVLVIIISCFNSVAQTDTLYFNAQWKFIKKKDGAKYYRTFVKISDSLYGVTDHFMNGDVQMTGFYSNPRSDDDKLRNGVFVYYNDSRKKASEGEYKNGRKEKQWTYYYEDGSVTSVVNYKDYKLDGPAKYYDSATGKKTSEGRFVNALRVGEWRFYYLNDSLFQIINYKSDTLDGVYQKFDSLTGKLVADGAFVKDKRNGVWKVNRADGRPVSTITYVDGKERGEFAIYDSLTGKKFAGGNMSEDSGDLVANYPGTNVLYFKGVIDPKTQIKKFTYYDSVTHHVIKEATFLLKSPYGTWKYYYPSTGKLYYEEKYKNGLVEGDFAVKDSLSDYNITTGQFSKGQRVGEWKYFSSGSGKLLLTEAYRKGRLHGSAYMYDSLGNVKSVSEYKNGLENGEWILYYEGSKQKWVVWNVVDDSLDGKLYSYYSTGKLKRYELYKRGNLEKSVCYDESGKETEYYPLRTDPEFYEDVMTYIGNNLRYPENARTEGLEGKVIVRFAINESGSVSEVQVIEGFNKECDEEALRVVSQMPLWKPSTMDGLPQKVYKTLPIVFWIH